MVIKLKSYQLALIITVIFVLGGIIGGVFGVSQSHRGDYLSGYYDGRNGLNVDHAYVGAGVDNKIQWGDKGQWKETENERCKFCGKKIRIVEGLPKE
jgi:hypothetical protein